MAKTSLSQMEPKAVWENFEQLTKVPRPSKKEGKVLAYLIDWAKKHNLEYKQDAAGNIVIKKPATKGMENRATVALQGHVDMVCEKNSGVKIDFDNDPIDAYVDGDYVKANGTTLGADNGIGVSMALAVLESKDIPHPAIEALFTIDEETGLTGANRLGTDMLKAKILLNLDSENEAEFTIGCAGGINTRGEYDYIADAVPIESKTFQITVTGCRGGHSGLEIGSDRANAVVMLSRILLRLTRKVNARLVSFDAPGKHNAIPREAKATVVIKNVALDDFKSYLDDCNNVIIMEYIATEPDLRISYEEVPTPKRVMTIDSQKKFIDSLFVIPHGVFRWSPEIPGLVQTSTNLAVIETNDEKISILTSQRSSVESEKIYLSSKVRISMELGNAFTTFSEGYPAWTPNVNSKILKIAKDVYKKTYNKDPKIVAIHAGLECGIIGEKYPGMEMLSFGPNLFDVHSPSERVQISSVKNVWKFLLELLKNIPENGE
ncbi:MAG TPA: aminoacyl-histidine dipeptidase [Candidatus Kapabacteria bacterium]|jgi:dipeptidase D|nr:aminoacyl-histidine dipeptidase [Candidatus Kapabacteria bacterium]HOV92622.1 aminoacyl-histidine dipeptidase [Candidatus Kapabacteria bacterium]